MGTDSEGTPLVNREGKRLRKGDMPRGDRHQQVWGRTGGLKLNSGAVDCFNAATQKQHQGGTATAAHCVCLGLEREMREVALFTEIVGGYHTDRCRPTLRRSERRDSAAAFSLCGRRTRLTWRRSAAPRAPRSMRSGKAPSPRGRRCSSPLGPDRIASPQRLFLGLGPGWTWGSSTTRMPRPRCPAADCLLRPSWRKRVCPRAAEVSCSLTRPTPDPGGCPRSWHHRCRSRYCLAYRGDYDDIHHFAF